MFILVMGLGCLGNMGLVLFVYLIDGLGLLV